ncbi:YczE/YyaS/YitT family protein [Alkalibacterium kapii]|uniref:Integral membrane protein n=1 Tax=Alkalibacterium kapii TaxID=426704 RepID=A0A511ARB7_9LACT|nr:hypothetical protein [Alkalibacterium kapii]GEK90749.1 hypothetical protein AKA01nite_03710 [Alkalibacterium kapii]
MSFDWKNFLLGSLTSIIGITFISFGAALSEKMNMGLDPFTAINRGASSLLGFSLGNYQLVVNLIILMIVFLMKRSLIGWGTIYNMILVGYQVEFFNTIFSNIFNVEAMGLLLRLIVTVIAILIFTFGVAIYMDTELGVSPYDAIAPLITDRTSWSYTPVRVGQDLLVVAGAFLLSGPVGISTIITGFFAGPLINFFSKRVSQPLLKNLTQS